MNCIGCARKTLARRRPLVRSFSSLIREVEPPFELEDGIRERPTPLLFMPSPFSDPVSFEPFLSHFSRRGFTSCSMSYSSPLTLASMQEDLVGAMGAMQAIPPVIVAHCIGGYIAQKHLESYPASALVLVDSFPPYPAASAERALDNNLASGNEHLLHELLEPEADVFLEPRSVPMLILGTPRSELVGVNDMQAVAAFHAVDSADVEQLSEARSPAFDGAFDTALADRIYAWVDLRV